MLYWKDHQEVADGPRDYVEARRDPYVVVFGFYLISKGYQKEVLKHRRSTLLFREINLKKE
jgi:hypothetical protein